MSWWRWCRRADRRPRRSAGGRPGRWGRSPPSRFGGGAAEEVDAFAGSTFGVFADDQSLAAFGANPLDPACRKPSALAGREQGRRVAAAVAEFLARFNSPGL